MAQSVGPIVPLVFGDPIATMSAARELESQGFLVGAIRPPTVPNGTSRLRISLTTAFDETDIIELANALAPFRKDCEVIGS